VQIALHPDIETAITIIVARNNEEAARIERGEDVKQLREDLAPEEAAVLAAEAFFEPEAAQALDKSESAESDTVPAAEKD
jgi:large subunit ribosomal protein L9